MDFGKTVGIAFLAFASTNIDDLAVLLTFFTEARLGSSDLKARHIFITQYIGIISLICISLGGYGISYALPGGLIGFLGFIPIAMGFKWGVELIREWKEDRNKISLPSTDDTNEDKSQSIDTTDSQPASDEYKYKHVELKVMESTSAEFPVDQPNVESEQGAAVLNGSTTDYQTVIGESTDQEPTNTRSERIKAKLRLAALTVVSPQVLKIALITLGNGGDNIGIYVPLFAQADGLQVVVVVAVFLVLIFVWCLACYLLVSRPFVLKYFQKYGRYLIPFVLIGLGIYIIIESNAFPWLVQVIQRKKWGNYEDN